jgi:phosphoribosylanthranilate isomerase
MFRIKICGITNCDDALAAATAGADAIGLNFFNQSRRFVDATSARRIATALPADVMKVGVFVNATADEITHVVENVGLDAVQLHGNEPPRLVGQFPTSVGLLRAIRCGADGLAPLATFLTECRSRGRLPDAVLVDADAGGEFGGSGRLADWTVITEQRTVLAELPMILAGGLTPENVGQAIATVRPDGVDVASGVESSPGKKDAAMVRDFIAAAREEFSRL